MLIAHARGRFPNCPKATLVALGYDNDGWPVQWKMLGGTSDKSVAALRADNIKLAPHGTYDGSGSFWGENGNPTSATQLRVIVAKAKLLDGTEWTNPLYEQWRAIYVGNMLPN